MAYVRPIVTTDQATPARVPRKRLMQRYAIRPWDRSKAEFTALTLPRGNRNERLGMTGECEGKPDGSPIQGHGQTAVDRLVAPPDTTSHMSVRQQQLPHTQAALPVNRVQNAL